MTPKQARFVEEYLIDLNAVQAAIRAGYAKTTAYSQGPRMLAHPEVVVAVRNGLVAKAERAGVNATWVLRELVDNVYLAKQAGKIEAANRALELLGDHIGFFPDRGQLVVSGEVQHEHNHAGTISIVDRLEALAGSFVGAANRSGPERLPANGAGEPLDPSEDQAGHHPKAS